MVGNNTSLERTNTKLSSRITASGPSRRPSCKTSDHWSGDRDFKFHRRPIEQEWEMSRDAGALLAPHYSTESHNYNQSNSTNSCISSTSPSALSPTRTMVDVILFCLQIPSLPPLCLPSHFFSQLRLASLCIQLHRLPVFRVQLIDLPQSLHQSALRLPSALASIVSRILQKGMSCSSRAFLQSTCISLCNDKTKLYSREHLKLFCKRNPLVSSRLYRSRVEILSTTACIRALRIGLLITRITFPNRKYSREDKREVLLGDVNMHIDDIMGQRRAKRDEG